jgi:hypothetical protein
MRNVPTLFQRDANGPTRVIDQVNPACAWVIQGEGAAHRMFNGACMMFDGQRWYARRKVEKGADFPLNFETVDFDPATGKTVGWVPMVQSSFLQWHNDALMHVDGYSFHAGTYELCGPKINGNPEHFDYHVLVPHSDTELLANVPRTYEGLKKYLTSVPYEGVVWHHLDGRMAKLKGRDFSW